MRKSVPFLNNAEAIEVIWPRIAKQQGAFSYRSASIGGRPAFGDFRSAEFKPLREG
jgi:hypothetical protein